jgi:hypothetical protein
LIISCVIHHCDCVCAIEQAQQGQQQAPQGQWQNYQAIYNWQQQQQKQQQQQVYWLLQQQQKQLQVLQLLLTQQQQMQQQQDKVLRQQQQVRPQAPFLNSTTGLVPFHVRMPVRLYRANKIKMSFSPAGILVDVGVRRYPGNGIPWTFVFLDEHPQLK